MKNKLIFLLLIFVVLATTGLSCSSTTQEVLQKSEPITLTFWRVWDGPDAFDTIISDYKKLHPNITIDYRKFTYAEYEQQLLNAFAEDRGPDIFSIHNTWIKKYQSKIAPMPAQTTMAYQVEQGTIKKETVTQLKTSSSLTLKDLKNNFVDAVYSDVVIKVSDVENKTSTEQVFGLPMSVDTLAMFYNKDLLNNAGIATPPAYWNTEFQQDVKKLTKQDTGGNIIQSGVAMGGSQNIERYSDILSVLMMQNGAKMMDDSGSVLLQSSPDYYRSQGYNPALEALRFYIDFSDPAKEVYSWNSTLSNSLNMFTQGKLALMFGYAYHLPTIRATAPKLNFGIAELPQIEGGAQKINFANYWVETVSKKSKNTDAAWDFIQFATKAENVKSYLAATKKPTALRSLISSQLNDLDISPFANQVLTAQSWYKGADSNAMELIMGDMIDSAVKGEDKINNLLNIAGQRIQQTVR